MVYIAFTAEHARLEYSFSSPLAKISLQGRFRIGGDMWQAYPPNDMAVLRTVGEEIVEFSGQYTADIPAGRTVFVYVRHVRATLAINGVSLFAVGGEDTSPAFTRSPGNFWGSFVSPGIKSTDSIAITLQRVASNSHPFQLELFLENMHTGSVWELLKKELHTVWWSVPLAGLFIAMSVLLLILAALFAWHGETLFALRATFLAGIYIFMTLWTLVGYEVVSLLIPFPTFVIVWETFSILIAGSFIILYIATLLTGMRRAVACSIASFCFATMFISVILQLTGYAELFVIQTYLQLINLCAVVLSILLCFFEKKITDKASMQTFMTFIPPCLIGSMDLVFSSSGPATQGLFCCIGFLFAAVFQIFLLLNAAYKKMEQAGSLQRELVESRIAVSLSQIRPHFLYNILTGIQYLCAEDPARAKQAVTDFTMFLRGNLDSLSSAAPIPLAQELEHLRHYLALEQLRYGDKLRVVWDLGQVDFTVPALSVQPLAENAVHWGMREEGLTVCIATRATDDGYAVIVEDNGTGFDPHEERPPRGNGIGLASIQSRVRDVYGGSLHIDSKPDKGTIVTVLFPRIPLYT